MAAGLQSYQHAVDCAVLAKARDGNARRDAEARRWMDEGKSGLRLDGRDALKRLIADVQSGRADFEVILVYDVSRWGRFQDADEPAYYEHLCRRAGIIVLYCAEQFENDGGPLSNLIKSVKRTMAGEYSRELSTKVFRGQCRLIQLGFRQGGMPGYGLRRMLVDHAGKRKGALGHGEHKSIQTDRVILVPGPREETKTVEWIFRQFVEEEQTESDIADALNEQGITTDLGQGLRVPGGQSPPADNAPRSRSGRRGGDGATWRLGVAGPGNRPA